MLKVMEWWRCHGHRGAAYNRYFSHNKEAFAISFPQAHPNSRSLTTLLFPFPTSFLNFAHQCRERLFFLLREDALPRWLGKEDTNSQIHLSTTARLGAGALTER